MINEVFKEGNASVLKYDTEETREKVTILNPLNEDDRKILIPNRYSAVIGATAK